MTRRDVLHRSCIFVDAPTKRANCPLISFCVKKKKLLKLFSCRNTMCADTWARARVRPCMCANSYSTMCRGPSLCVRWCGSVSDRRCRDQWIADDRFHISYPGLRVARRIRQKVAANSIYLTRWLIICQFVPAAWAISARHREFALIKSIALAGNVLSFSPRRIAIASKSRYVKW